jgi:hypothetical protein
MYERDTKELDRYNLKNCECAKISKTVDVDTCEKSVLRKVASGDKKTRDIETHCHNSEGDLCLVVFKEHGVVSIN